MRFENNIQKTFILPYSLVVVPFFPLLFSFFASFLISNSHDFHPGIAPLPRHFDAVYLQPGAVWRKFDCAGAMHWCRFYLEFSFTTLY